MIDNQFKKNRKTFHLGISCCLITSFYMLTVRCSFYSLLVFCCSHLRSTFFLSKITRDCLTFGLVLSHFDANTCEVKIHFYCCCCTFTRHMLLFKYKWMNLISFLLKDETIMFHSDLNWKFPV